MIVKLLTENHLEFLSLKGGCRGSSESTLVKMSNCWKSHAGAQIVPVGASSPPSVSYWYNVSPVWSAQSRVATQYPFQNSLTFH